MSAPTRRGQWKLYDVSLHAEYRHWRLCRAPARAVRWLGLQYLFLVAIAFLRSVAAVFASIVRRMFLYGACDVDDADDEMISAGLAAGGLPVILIPGNMGNGQAATAHYTDRGARVFCPPLGPVSSCHDRACELFYALKGGRLDFGEAHSRTHRHAQFGADCGAGALPSWSETEPIVFVTHSQGVNTALALQKLLRDAAFPGHATSAAWVAGVVAIAAPFRGAGPALEVLGAVPRATHTRKLECECEGCVEPAPYEDGGVFDATDDGGRVGGERVNLRRRKANGSGNSATAGNNGCCAGAVGGKWPSCARLEQQVGPRLRPVGFGITVGYVSEVLAFRFWLVKTLVFDWRLDQWRLGWRDLWPLLDGTHPLLHSADTALIELTRHGAANVARALSTHSCSFYVSLPCRITGTAAPLSLASDALPPKLVSPRAAPHQHVPPYSLHSPRSPQSPLSPLAHQPQNLASHPRSDSRRTHSPASTLQPSPLPLELPLLPVPSPTATPEHVLLAALIAWCSHLDPSQPADPLALRVRAHSDGMVPTESQLCPLGHAQRPVPQLTPPPPPTTKPTRAGAGGPEGGAKDAAAQRGARHAKLLHAGAWCIADPALCDHTTAALTPSSPLLRHALRVVVPAIAEAAARARQSAAQRVPV